MTKVCVNYVRFFGHCMRDTLISVRTDIKLLALVGDVLDNVDNDNDE